MSPGVRALPRLLVLTDRSQLPLGRGLLRTLAECRDAGLTHVVLRELDEPISARAALAASLADLGLQVLAAHAWLPGAAGVHLPSRPSGRAGRPLAAERVATDAVSHCAGLDTPPPGGSGGSTSEGGSAGGGRGVRGRSCHSREEVARAAAEQFDYVTLSPYAATVSKPGYGPPLEAGALRGHSIPVYALGGITPANAGQAVAAGAYGVAVMGEVMRAAEPALVVHELLAALAPAAGAALDEGGPAAGRTPGRAARDVPAPSIPTPEWLSRPPLWGGQR